LLEGESKDETHRLRSNAFPKTMRIENSDGERGAAIQHINAIKAGFADYSEAFQKTMSRRGAGTSKPQLQEIGMPWEISAHF
jgi:hypothetical protein